MPETQNHIRRMRLCDRVRRGLIEMTDMPDAFDAFLKIEGLLEQLEAYEHALSFIADWPTKLFPASVTAYTPMVVHDCAARALQRASNPANKPKGYWIMDADTEGSKKVWVSTDDNQESRPE